ncbi:MAG: DUF1501 domain-containing protein [Gemmataceae bacterium]
MIRLLGSPKRMCDGVTRRDWLHLGGLGLLGVGLSDFLRLQSAQAAGPRAGRFGQAKACILLYKYGSPPQHETFDPKPYAPAEVRGEMKSISTRVPGLRVCEHLPHRQDHGPAHRGPLTDAPLPAPRHRLRHDGHPRRGHEDRGRAARPPPVAVHRIRRRLPPGPPNRREAAAGATQRRAAVPLGSRTEIPPLAGPYATWPSARYDPVFTDFAQRGARPAPVVRGKVFHDPYLAIRPDDRITLGGEGGAGVPPAVVDARRSLLSQFDRARAALEADERVAAFGQQQKVAYSLLTSGKVHRALDVGREPAAVRESYGMTLFGQGALAARRLVEAGCQFVTVFFDAYGLNAGGWDTHDNHFARLKDFLLPVFDQTYSALILDLEARGLLDETLVLCLSEHGRTPRLNPRAKGGGRDHWSRAYCQVFAGGGVGRGNLVGSTDAIGGDVRETPVSPKDVLATTFHLLGIDAATTFPDRLGRPVPIAGAGAVRAELLA